MTQTSSAPSARPAPAGAPHPAAGPRDLDFSLVICTRNRVDEVLRLLASIARQTRAPSEIVIVDSSDTARLEEALRGVNAGSAPVCHVKSSPGLTHQRNVGVDSSRGGLVCFLDDDLVLDPPFVEALAEAFVEHPELGGAMGNIRPVDSVRARRPTLHTRLLRAIARIHLLPRIEGSGRFLASGFASMPLGNREFQFTECLSGGLTVWRREVFREFRFDEILQGYCYMEDDDFSRRVSRKWKLGYVPQATCLHLHAEGGRPNLRERRKMLVENHHFLFQRNFPQTAGARLAHLWSIVGLFVYSMAARDFQGARGVIDGICSLRRGGGPMRRARETARQDPQKFWDAVASQLHIRYGDCTGGHELVAALLREHQPRRLLDLGCGTGRFFPLYEGIGEVWAADISHEALALAPDAPNIRKICGRAQDLDLPPGHFDLCLSNMVLEHIPHEDIAVVCARLASACRKVWLSENIRGRESEYEFRHDFESLFGRCGMRMTYRKAADEYSDHFLFEAVNAEGGSGA